MIAQASVVSVGD